LRVEWVIDLEAPRALRERTGDEHVALEEARESGAAGAVDPGAARADTCDAVAAHALALYARTALSVAHDAPSGRARIAEDTAGAIGLPMHSVAAVGYSQHTEAGGVRA